MSKPLTTHKNQESISTSLLRLLIVEDVIEDAELIVISLETAELNFVYERVDNATLCQEKLSENIYDAVLADYRLPSFNGLEAFKLLQNSGQEIPFILVTGSLGEEAAVECIKIGMTDYVLKDHLFRLPSVLRRSLEEFELRRQQKEAIAKIEASAKKEAMINRIIQAMRASLVLDDILQITIEQLREVLQVSSSLIVQPDFQQKMKVAYISMESPEEGKNFLGVDCDFYEYYHDILIKGEQIVIDQITPEIQELANSYQIKSMIITPLFYGTSYLGGISLYQRDYQRTWTENEISLVQTIAAHCAIAIHQAKLYQQAQTELKERKEAEFNLRKSERRFKALIENATDIIIILDTQGICRYLSPSTQRICDYDYNRLIDQSLINFIHSEDKGKFEDIIKIALAEPGITQPTLEYRFCPQTDACYILETVITNLLHDPAIEGIALNCHDVTQRKKAEDKLRHGALHDTLTGLPNRTLFLEFLEQAIKKSQSRQNYHFAVLFLDLDRFKTVNDSLGHLAGDELLIALAHRLEKCQRGGDTVARLGGDEFVILLDNISHTEEAITVAERIKQALAPPFVLNEQEVFISASIGITVSSQDYQQPEHLLRDADTAMYYAKGRGKSCYELFNPSMHTKVMRQLQLETNLRRALEREEFIVYYQPIVCLKTNLVNGFEALVRWEHPEQGLISPAEFIPLAEETGLITILDHWVLKQACQQLKIWQQKFPAIIPLSVSVNLSGKQFSQPNLIEEIDKILLETGLQGEYLKLEVTESVLIENAESAAFMLKQLKERNIQIYIDDFGTGYSSLNYLYRFPIDKLKIDRSFIVPIEKQNKNKEIVRTIITLSHSLSIKAIAEGVETENQLKYLKELGCDEAQGYLFSQPVNGELAEKLLPK